jgi:hypothetical protein
MMGILLIACNIVAVISVTNEDQSFKEGTLRGVSFMQRAEEDGGKKVVGKKVSGHGGEKGGQVQESASVHIGNKDVLAAIHIGKQAELSKVTSSIVIGPDSRQAGEKSPNTEKTWKVVVVPATMVISFILSVVILYGIDKANEKQEYN